MNELQGVTVLTTRDAAQADDLKNKLAQWGADVICLPTIRIIDPPDWQAFDEAARQPRFDWVIFTSINAVKKTQTRLQHLGIALERMAAKIAAVGDQTAKQIEDCGWSISLVPEKFQGEGLLEALIKTGLTQKRIWLPRALDARDLLIKGLEKAGASVTFTPVYQNTLPLEQALELQTILKRHRIDWITFTSSSTVTNFFKMLGEIPAPGRLPKLASIGSVTTRTLRGLSQQPEFTAEPQNLEGLCQGILNWQRLFGNHPENDISRKGSEPYQPTSSGDDRQG